MAIARDLSRAQLAFQVTGRDVDEFSVIRFKGSEGLCQLYRFEIDLASPSPGAPLTGIVGKPAVLSINTSSGEKWFHGIVGRMEMTGETVGQTYFRAELVPALWLLTHRYCSRIFQNKNVKELITEVLTQAGIPSDRFNLDRLTATYETREYCVQYRETDFNFICRLMEEEGIWYYFEQAQDKHVLILAEKKADYAPIPDDAKLPYHPPTGLNVEDDHVYRFRLAQAIRPGAVTLTDFNFENPKLNLESKADNARDAGLMFSDYPGEYMAQDRGTAVAKRRSLEFEARRIVGHGQSNCRRLGPGKTFTLIEHPAAGFDGAYLITRITHQGKEAIARTSTGSNGRGSILDARSHQAIIAARNNDNPVIAELANALLQLVSRFRAGDPTANRALSEWLYHAGQVSRDLSSNSGAAGGNPLEWLSIPNLISDLAQTSVIDFDTPVYDCDFECIPASVEFVPSKVTPWPVMRGTQTARVVGPKDEEIQVDKFGRVKVQFPWDLQGNEGGQPKLHGADSSCWIRVCQGWAGGQYGIMFIPRVGQEVVVDFLEGDPDKPIIIGRVFNADHMPPYELPKEKTKSVIKTNSSKGGGGCNEIRFEDLKDKEQLLLQAQRQMDTHVKASHFHSVGGSYHLTVGGEYDGELSGEYREKVFKAKHVHIKGEMRTWVEKDEGRAVNGAQAIAIGGTKSLLVRDDAIEVYEANHKHEVTGTLAISAADVKIEATGTLELVCGGSSVILAPGGVYITGSMVYINSGSGPTVTPPGTQGYCPAAAEDAGGAESTQPGKDTRYSGPSEPPPKLQPLPEVPGHDFDQEQPPNVEKVWVAIRLRDEFGQPVAGEAYRIEAPGGILREGSLDANGFARENGLDPGVCEVTFPRLDKFAWRKGEPDRTLAKSDEPGAVVPADPDEGVSLPGATSIDPANRPDPEEQQQQAEAENTSRQQGSGEEEEELTA